MKIGDLIFATKDSYLAQRPKHWDHLAALALERLQGRASPYPPADWIIHLGAHTAPEEERVLDAPLWANPPQAIGLAIHYGIVLKAALRTSNTENYTYLIGHLSTMHVPVPSAQAMIDAAHKLNLELKIEEVDLRQHTLQHRPYFGALHPLRWPSLIS